MVAIIVAIATTTVASSWKFAVLADIEVEPNSAYDSIVAVNTLISLVQDIKDQGIDLVIFPAI